MHYFWSYKETENITIGKKYKYFVIGREDTYFVKEQTKSILKTISSRC